MDLQPTTTTYGTQDLSALASSADLSNAQTFTFITDDLVSGKHYTTDGRLVNLVPMAKYTSGANSGSWGPWAQDATDGREDMIGLALGGEPVKLDGAGAPSAVAIVGALLYRCMVKVPKLPGSVLADKATAYTILASDLPSGITAVLA